MNVGTAAPLLKGRISLPTAELPTWNLLTSEGAYARERQRCEEATVSPGTEEAPEVL